MRSRSNYPKALILIIVMTIILSACSTPQKKTGSERFVVNFDDGTTAVVSEEALETVASFDTNVSYITSGPDDRHVFMSNRKEGYVQVLDTGVYDDKTGSPVEAEPILYDYTMEGKEPAHIVSNAGTTAIFYDGSGVIELYKDTDLVRNDAIRPEPIQIGSVPAHHGVAVPVNGAGFITSTIPNAADKTRGNGIQKVEKDGQVIEIEAEILRLHGEAASKVGDKELFTFGGEGKVFVYDAKTNEGEDILLPDKEARVGSFASDINSKYLIGNYGSKEKPELGTNITVINVDNKTVEKVDLKTAYLYFFAHDSENTAYVLGTNGVMFIIDLEAKAIKDEVKVMDPWESGEGKVVPSIAITEKNVIITDSKTKTIKVINQKDLLVTESKPFEKTPRLVTTA